MATTSKTNINKTASTDTEDLEFKVLDFTPAKKAAGGRAKSALRTAIENLQPGMPIDTGFRVSDDDEELRKQILGKVRSMVGDISSKNEGMKFSVFVSDDDRLDPGTVVVLRKDS